MKLDKKRLFLSVSVCLAVCALMLAHHIIWRKTGMGIPCPIYKIFGIQCAGCGMSRAAFALLTLDLAKAHSHHLLVIPTLLYLLWFIGSAIIRFSKHEKIPLDVKPYFVHFIFISIFVAYGIVRIFLPI